MEDCNPEWAEGWLKDLVEAHLRSLPEKIREALVLPPQNGSDLPFNRHVEAWIFTPHVCGPC